MDIGKSMLTQVTTKLPLIFQSMERCIYLSPKKPPKWTQAFWRCCDFHRAEGPPSPKGVHTQCISRIKKTLSWPLLLTYGTPTPLSFRISCMNSSWFFSHLTHNPVWSHAIAFHLICYHSTNLLIAPHDCQMISLAMTAVARCAALFSAERGTGSQLASVRRMQLGWKLGSFQWVRIKTCGGGLNCGLSQMTRYLGTWYPLVLTIISWICSYD